MNFKVVIFIFLFTFAPHFLIASDDLNCNESSVGRARTSSAEIPMMHNSSPKLTLAEYGERIKGIFNNYCTSSLLGGDDLEEDIKDFIKNFTSHYTRDDLDTLIASIQNHDFRYAVPYLTFLQIIQEILLKPYK